MTTRELCARKIYALFVQNHAFELFPVSWEMMHPAVQKAWLAIAEQHLWEMSQQLVEIRRFPCCTEGCGNDAILCSRRCGL